MMEITMNRVHFLIFVAFGSAYLLCLCLKDYVAMWTVCS